MKDINDMIQALDLGMIMEAPASVSGGFLHKMYRVTTTKGVWAVKVLNEEIMKRPVALHNMIYSEKIAARFIDSVPVVAAVELMGKQVHHVEGQYYMVFPWIEGESIFPPKITEIHCETIGEILGKIHSMNVSVEGVVPERDTAKLYEWEAYMKMAEAKGLQQTAWFIAYKEALENVLQLNKSVCAAQNDLTRELVISHRDLDPKNVMWNKERPMIIDWEAAGYVNPYQELLEVINYWTDDGRGSLHKRYLEVLLQAYRKNRSLQGVDWEPVFAGSFSGMLGWLEYNVKRALGIEVTCEEDVRAGEEQVLGTIAELYAYERKLETIKEVFQSQKVVS